MIGGLVGGFGRVIEGFDRAVWLDDRGYGRRVDRAVWLDDRGFGRRVWHAIFETQYLGLFSRFSCLQVEFKLFIRGVLVHRCVFACTYRKMSKNAVGADGVI